MWDPVQVNFSARARNIDRDRVQRELCAQIVLGRKDPAKMEHAKMDLAERGLGAKRAHANHSQYDYGRVCVRAHGQR